MLESFSNSHHASRAANFLHALRGGGACSPLGDALGRPAPRAQRKFLKPKATCSRCERFSFLAADQGQACHAMVRGQRCGGRMMQADALGDWSACQWCAGFGWHRGMSCIKCEGSGWVRSLLAGRLQRSLS